MNFHKRNRIAPLTPVRARRLIAGLTLVEVSEKAELTTFRVSIIERDPSQARAGELESHRDAIDALVRARSDAA